MVDKAMEFVEQEEGADKLALIETLREITEGKVRFLSCTPACFNLEERKPRC